MVKIIISTLVLLYSLSLSSQIVIEESREAQSWLTLHNALYFYEKTKPFHEFTNFEDGYPITIENELWLSVEHYYQAQKFLDIQKREYIKSLATALEALKQARSWKAFVREDWRDINFDIMLTALRAKFTQHLFLRDMLLSTGDRILVADAKQNGSFFGAGADYKGKNHLGVMLMQLRKELRGESEAHHYVWHDWGYFSTFS